MNLFWSILLKPFAAVALFVLAWAVARTIHRFMPEGRLKRILFSPLPGHRRRR
jgi:membrane protein required for beta-lactamase induction